MKIFTKKQLFFTLFFIIIFQLGLFFIVSSSHALEFKPNVNMPGFTPKAEDLSAPDKDNPKYMESTLLGKYINAIYNYALGIVGIVATFALMVGGMIWIVSAGSSERVTMAKAWIGSGVSGLALMMCGYTILYVINPDLVAVKSIRMLKTEKVELGCCKISTGAVDSNRQTCTVEKKGTFVPDFTAINNECKPDIEGCCIDYTFGSPGNDSTYDDCHDVKKSNCDTARTQTLFKEQACSEIAKCPKNCALKKDGAECKTESNDSGFCYDNVCATEKGKLHEKCGGINDVGKCESDASCIWTHTGGRNCLGSNYCCDL